MNKSIPKQKQGLTLEFMENGGGGNLETGALNGGTLSLFFNENKKEALEYVKPAPENKMKNIY